MTVQELITKLGFETDENALKKYQAGLQKAEKIARGVTLVVAGIGVASLKSFAQQEKAERLLESSLKASGQEVSNNLKSMKEYASELQNLSVVGDETSLMLMQIAISSGLNAEQSKQATKDAIGMASAFNIDVKSAIKATTLAQQGNYDMLNRYIPAVRLATTEEEKASIAKKALSDAFKVATSEIETTTGQIKQVKNSFGDFLEQVGAVLATGLIPLIKNLKTATKFLSSLDKNTISTAVNIALLVAGIYPLIKIMQAMAVIFRVVTALKLGYAVATGAVMATELTSTASKVSATAVMIAQAVALKAVTVAQWLLNTAMMANPIGLIIAGIIATIALAYLLYKNWTIVSETFRKWGFILKWVLGPIGLLINMIVQLIDLWKMAKAGFASGGIIGALKAIGIGLLNFVLNPIIAILNLLSKLPGMGNIAGSAIDKINQFKNFAGDKAGVNNDKGVIPPMARVGMASNNSNSSSNTTINSQVSIGVPAGTSEQQSKFIQEDVRKVIRQENEKMARRSMRGAGKVE